jgi:hypothetical protein
LSANFLRHSLQNGIGYRTERKFQQEAASQLLQQYTQTEEAHLLSQLYAVLKVASLGHIPLFQVGFVIWAPRVTYPPLFCAGSSQPSLIFLMNGAETDRGPRIGTVAFQSREQVKAIPDNLIPRFVSSDRHIAKITELPINGIVRICNKQHFLNSGENATQQCPGCASCFASTIGGGPCILHI